MQSVHSAAIMCAALAMWVGLGVGAGLVVLGLIRLACAAIARIRTCR